MRQIRVHGRGGQGARRACRVLAGALSRAGWRARALGASGAELPGVPVVALVQVDDHPAVADDVLLLDPALFGAFLAAASPGGLVLVAGPVMPCGRAPGAAGVVALDAAAIAEACGLGPDIGTTMAGAFGGASGLVALDTLEAAIAESHLARPGAHLVACRAGYRAAARARSYHMAT